MATEKDKFLIIVKSGTVKPQQKTISLGGQPWELEWSTSSDVPMSIDFFNLTVGKYSRTTNDRQEQVKKIEEYWRITGIPGHARKIRYGFNAPESTSTPAKKIEDGIYVVKITGMSTITEGLHAETGVGMAVIKLALGSIEPAESSASHVEDKSSEPNTDSDRPVTITNEVLVNLLKLTEE
ncbi:hypothetical protein JNM05_15305 [bacterium]|nr:hypothetical protein [bacterium]